MIEHGRSSVGCDRHIRLRVHRPKNVVSARAGQLVLHHDATLRLQELDAALPTGHGRRKDIAEVADRVGLCQRCTPRGHRECVRLRRGLLERVDRQRIVALHRGTVIREALAQRHSADVVRGLILSQRNRPVFTESLQPEITSIQLLVACSGIAGASEGHKRGERVGARAP